ncbi:MAG: nucleotide exchange factor GrpE [Desulforhabdus sp.]|jgi:molecular chaperone GrpE|nr:nucleotide exchange factor GrpE [Desulforhabdus sp.]
MVNEQKEKEEVKLNLEGEEIEKEGDSAESDASIQECEELLSQKEVEIKQLQDRTLRLAAEMENTRKRLEREKIEGICFANESLLRELLSVADNLERAIQHAEGGADFESLLEGMRMINKGFLDTLAKFGCKPFESKGSDFDPNIHEAVMQQEVEGEVDNKVIQELQKGFKLNDRLLRPAMVVVSKAPS